MNSIFEQNNIFKDQLIFLKNKINDLVLQIKIIVRFKI